MLPMFPNSRKLLPPVSDESPHFSISPSANSHSSKITEDKETENPSDSNGVSCCAYNNLTLNPPFDSAMALTVLVLLTALFFMGFFSIYIRRFADESSVDTRRRSRNATTTTSYQPRLRVSTKGVDPATIESLPVHVYNDGVEKQEIGEMELECAICLSEFEERECVKEIPYCGHVFHVECIDTWLLSHVTCPLCRTAKLFPAEEKNEVEVDGEGHVACGEEGGSGVIEVHENDESDAREVRLMVEMSDTWRDVEHEVEGLSVTRTTECSVNGDRVTLHRSLSL